jgi:hypothetical protein
MHAVRRHGGDITCQSTLGVGTVFTFAMAQALPQGGPMSDTHHVTVLLVEDDPWQARLREPRMPYEISK